MELLGHLERLLSNIYPYRWVIGLSTVVAAGALVAFAWRRGWHRAALRHRTATLLAALVFLSVAIPAGNYLLSPLWTRSTLDEASPLQGVVTVRVTTTAASIAAPSTTTPVVPPASATLTIGASQPPAPPALAPTASLPATPTPMMVSQPATTAPTSSSEPTVPPAPEPTSEPAPAPAPTDVPRDPTPEQFVPHVTHRGEFYGADDFHFGRGTALVIHVEPGRYVLRFEDFSVRNGPDLRVYFSTNPDGYSAEDYHVGPLRATDGAFNYDLPPGFDPAPYRSVIIWCEPFAVLFAVAPLAAE
jgi:hypothetical protein